MNAQPRTHSPSAPPMPPPPQYTGAQASPAQGYPQQPPYGNQYPQMGSDPASGTPNGMAAQSGLANHNQSPAKTVLGMSAPFASQGMTGPQQVPPGYPQQYPPNPSGQMPVQQPYGAPYRPSNQQPAQQGFSQYPQYQQGPGPYPSGSMPGYAPPNQYGGYGGAMPATPIDGQPQGEGKRSTLVRDILIGVAIAALVLGGFFIVKIFILDKRDEGPPTSTTSTIATIHIGMAAGVTADLLVDEKKIATVMDGQDIPVSAGRRHVVLVGPGGGKCEVNVTLEAGKTTPLKCQLESKVPAAGSDAGSAAAGSGAGSATAGSGAGSAVPAAAGSAAGSGAGSAAPKAAATAAALPVTPPTIDKTVTHPTVTPPTKTDTKASTEIKKTEIAKTETKLDKQTMPEAKSDKTKKSEPADASGKGYLAITSKPVAHILVDGVDSGLSTPISGKALSMSPGKHKITFVMGDDRYTFPITIVAGKTEQLDKDLQ
ncbi:MAG: hypothetical protein ABI591_07380, partial [Kofleriaceae bacterium]